MRFIQAIKQIKDIGMVIPCLMFAITGKHRMKVEIEWESKSFVYKAFRLYESIFWRRYGVRPESTMMRTTTGEVYFAFHTLEAALTHFEGFIFGLFPKMLPIRISVPMIVTPQGFPIFASPYLFAIAYDNSAALRTNGTSGNSTQAFTTSGSDRFMASSTMTSNNTVTATYNAVALTISNSISNSNGWELRGHYLVNPASGSNNFVVNFSTGGSQSGWTVTSYSGAKQTGQPDSNTTAAQVTTTPISLTTTVVATDSWVWGGVLALTTGDVSAGSGATMRSSIVGNGTGDLGTFDSNGGLAAGSRTIQVAISGTITNVIGVVMSIAPVPAVGPANVKTWDGLAIASVKTVDGLAIASVKTINGLN